MSCGRYFLGEEYVDLIYRRSDEPDPEAAGLKDFCISQINDKWGIIHLNINEAKEVTYEKYGYTSFPLLYTIQDYAAMSASGIIKVREQPFLDLRGNGTLIGIIDTGIRYTHEAFIKEDNTTVLEAVWDQTSEEGDSENAESSPGDGTQVPYGKVFTKEMINESLANPDSVPLFDDNESGHGTFMAGLAVGQENAGMNFTGAAPLAGLVFVKLKPAKQYLRDFYLVNDEAICYSEIDIIEGIKYLEAYAKRVGKPISIIIGLGANLSSHRGSSVLSDYVRDIGRQIGRCVTTCTGNYANKRLHFKGSANQDTKKVPVEIRVGEGERGFFASLWSVPPDNLELEIFSPLGQTSNRIVPVLNRTGIYRYGLEGTIVEVFYGINQAGTSINFLGIRFVNPSPGIWTINVYPNSGVDDSFDMWLSDSPFLWSDTFFLQPDPYDTITDPGNAEGVLTVGAYNDRDGSIFLESGRGRSAALTQKPDLVAPGVGVLGPMATRNNAYGEASGTSYAATIAGGSVALMFEYGIVRGQYPFMRGDSAINFLISGTEKNEGSVYPNPLFGYGYLNLYGAIEKIRR